MKIYFSFFLYVKKKKEIKKTGKEIWPFKFEYLVKKYAIQINSYRVFIINITKHTEPVTNYKWLLISQRSIKVHEH